jgi:hypothetical protein
MSGTGCCHISGLFMKRSAQLLALMSIRVYRPYHPCGLLAFGFTRFSVYRFDLLCHRGSVAFATWGALSVSLLGRFWAFIHD